MSHLSKVSLRMTNLALLRTLVVKRGWVMETEKTFTNPYSQEQIEASFIIRDSIGAVKLALDSTGFPVVDSYYMGHDYQNFCQEYAKEVLRQQACLEGYFYREVGTQPDGSVVIEVEVN